jgi:hypothetical protein
MVAVVPTGEAVGGASTVALSEVARSTDAAALVPIHRAS